jgi:hypothetical protein
MESYTGGPDSGFEGALSQHFARKRIIGKKIRQELDA